MDGDNTVLIIYTAVIAANHDTDDAVCAILFLIECRRTQEAQVGVTVLQDDGAVVVVGARGSCREVRDRLLQIVDVGVTLETNDGDVLATVDVL